MTPIVIAVMNFMAALGGAGDALRKAAMNDGPKEARLKPAELAMILYGLFEMPMGWLLLAICGVPFVPDEAWFHWNLYLVLVVPLIWTLYKAMAESHITLVMPLIGLGPVSIMVGEWAWFDRVPPAEVGIIAVVGSGVGTYVLMLGSIPNPYKVFLMLRHKLRRGDLRWWGAIWLTVRLYGCRLLRPLRAVRRESGVRWGVVSLILFGVAVPHLKATMATFPEEGSISTMFSVVGFMSVTEGAVLVTAFAIKIAWSRHCDGPSIRSTREYPWRFILPAGVCWVSHATLLYWGIFVINTSYAMAFRSLSFVALFAIAAIVIPGERKQIPQRIPGTVIIIASVVAIALLGD